jgi:hypothetical protein
MGDFNCIAGKVQVELVYLFDVWENWNAEGYNFGDKRCSEGKTVMQKIRSW